MHTGGAAPQDGPGDQRGPAPAATATLDARGVVTAWTERARGLLGHGPGDVVGRPGSGLLMANVSDTVSRAVREALSGGREWTGTAPVRHRDGHFVELDLRVSPLLGCDGRAQGFVVTGSSGCRGAHGAPGSARAGTAEAGPADKGPADKGPASVSPAEVSPPDAGPAAAGDGTATGARAMLDGAFTQSPLFCAVFDTGLRFLRMNETAARMLGLPENKVLGRPFHEVLHQPAFEEFHRVLCRVAESGSPACHESRSHAADPTRERAWTSWIWPVRDGAGEVCGIATATFDSSEQHRARQRLALLSEAGAGIGTTLDVVHTAQELVRLVVPRLADFVSVDLLDSVLRGEEPAPGPVGGSVVLRRLAHDVSEGGPRPAVELGEVDRYPEFSPPARSLSTGRPVLSRAGDPDFTLWSARNAARDVQVRESGIHSVMAVPLRARGITLGVAVFSRGEGSAPFGREDLVLAEELAGKAAVSVDNARRYTREHGTALALQRSLLPRRLPGQAAVEVASRYLPAGSQAGVGGDWFDVIPLSGTRVALVVGDVVGHGIHASATMGRLRMAVRTLADVDLPPDELLTHLDDLVTHLGSEDEDAIPPSVETAGELGATCLYAVYDPVSRRCTVASAGHPPPVVRLPDGTVDLIDVTAGPPLGIGGMPFESTERVLPEGSLLALYTDGLIEGRDMDPDAGTQALRTALAAPAASLEIACTALLSSMLPERPADDVALLIARTRALHADQVAEWDVPADPEHVAEARLRTSAQLTEWGLDEVAFVTELVVSELVTNAIRYGAAPVRLRLIRDRTLIIEVSDANSTAPHLRRAQIFDEGGRGLLLVAQLTQSWGTRQTPGGKTIWAEQSLANPSS
ncbi:SpoIIE family protein phosphatase [Streptomyces sp. GC420]|uniref:SpoIIE family protein phosphatase n=1 Tax=Streptomyces sp. GC420 TaxID=2697568 RepID=UPI0014151B42|nr:SpoIIE family protein phosphatase [Streptomyces sp. GC420]NBM15690.1 SpoIIE family protein phosphatase [Streptomyces sp. GC420]